jgi:hypothetical protein
MPAGAPGHNEIRLADGLGEVPPYVLQRQAKPGNIVDSRAE